MAPVNSSAVNSLPRSNFSAIPGCSEVPLIFGPAMASIYVDTGLDKFRHQRNNGLLQLGRSDTFKYCGAISRLLRDGLRVNHFGIDFSDVVQKRGLSWTMDDDVKAAMAMYWGNETWDTEFLVVPIDYEMLYRPRNMDMFVYGPRDRFSNFFRDGYVKITDFGVDLDRLREEIRIAKRAESWQALNEGNATWFRNMHFDALDPLMNNKAILELVSFYVGSDVVINGYQYWHVHANATTQQQRNTGEWHHDACGTRVKIFVYLHDVDEDRMVTEVAAGSQTYQKYIYGGVKPWFKTESVEHEWRVGKMTGPAGGGFLFDPNTIHRASSHRPHLSRDVVIVDISSSVKADVGIPAAKRPCPLHPWRTDTVNSRFEYPDKDHGPLTRDVVKKNNGRKAYEEYYQDIRSKYTNENYFKEFLEQKAETTKAGARYKRQKVRRIFQPNRTKKTN